MEFGAAPNGIEGNTTIVEIEATKNIEPLNAQDEEVACPIELRSPLGFRGIDVEQSPIESCVEVEIAFGSFDPIVLKMVEKNLEVINLQDIDGQLI